jgi:hypothetical protein
MCGDRVSASDTILGLDNFPIDSPSVGEWDYCYDPDFFNEGVCDDADTCANRSSEYDCLSSHDDETV